MAAPPRPLPVLAALALLWVALAIAVVASVAYSPASHAWFRARGAGA